MEKSIDNSGKPTPTKKSKLDPLSDSNESNSIIDGADKFVLFPLDIQETNSITTNPITQNKSTSQEDDFILFPLDINTSSNSINKNTQATSSSSNKSNQNKTKNNTPKPQPVTSPVPPNPTTPIHPVLKKTKIYWAVFFGFCGYPWVITKEYHILGITSLAISGWFLISYLYLRAKFSNRSSNRILIFTLILLVATGGYIGYNFLPKKTLVVNEVQVKLSAESADVADLTEEEAEYDRLVSSKEIADNIPFSYGYVNDYEKKFTDNQKIILDSLIGAFEKQTTIEIVILTLDSSQTTAIDFNDLTLKIAKKWGIGKKNKDNGILIALSSSLRIIRIQNGYGIEKVLTNEDTQKIIDIYCIPQFKKGDYFVGTKQCILAIIDKLK